MKNPIVVLLLVGLFQCTEPEKNDTQPVLMVVKGVIEADNKGNADSVMTYYPTTHLIPPDRPVIQADENIRRHYQKIFETSSVKFHIDAESIEVGKGCGRRNNKRVSKPEELFERELQPGGK